jgi:hypothetical protein
MQREAVPAEGRWRNLIGIRLLFFTLAVLAVSGPAGTFFPFCDGCINARDPPAKPDNLCQRQPAGSHGGPDRQPPGPPGFYCS